jgi:hypothetical protein
MGSTAVFGDTCHAQVAGNASSSYPTPLAINTSTSTITTGSQVTRYTAATSAGSCGCAAQKITSATSGTISQTVTLDIDLAQYTGDLKTVSETGYGISLGTYNNVTNTYEPGCSVTSAASASSRRAASVTYQALVRAELLALATSNAGSISSASLQAAMTQANALLGTSVTIPSVTGVQTPTVTTSSGTTTITPSPVPAPGPAGS